MSRNHSYLRHPGRCIAHHVPSARAPIVDRDKAANAIATSVIARMNASSGNLLDCLLARFMVLWAGAEARLGALFVLVWFSDDSRLAVIALFVLLVFVFLLIITIVGISRR